MLKKNKIIIVSILIVIFAVLLAVISYGGPIGLLDNLKLAPKPNSSAVIERRNGAIDSINKSFSSLETSTGFNGSAVSYHDRCYEGQNNWKVHDGYAHRCAYKVTKFYGFDGNFKDNAYKLDEAFIKSGWQSEWHGSLKKEIDTYYEVYGGPDSLKISQNYPNGRPVCELYHEAYIKPENTSNVLELRFGERNRIDTQCTRGINVFDSLQHVSGDTLFGTYNNNRGLVDGQSIVNQITSDRRFVIAISIQQTYFEN